MKPANARDQALVQDVMGMFKQLQDARRPIEPMWKEITENLYPQRSGWNFEEDSRVEAGDRIFDGTAIAAHSKLADGLFGWLVSPSIDWLKWEPENPKDRENKEMLEYCQDLERYLYDAFNKSNFYETLAQDIKDCSALGTSVIYGEEAEGLDRPYFTPLHLREAYISENKYGIVDTLFRDFEVTNRVMVEMFPQLDREMKAQAMKRPEDKVRLLHAMFPRKKGDITGAEIFRKNKPNASIYIYQGMSTQARSQAMSGGQILLENGGTSHKNFEAWRFEKTSGQTYGTCPAMYGIYDAKMMNLISKSLADVAQLAARPPLQAPESMRGKIRIYPGGISYRVGAEKIEPIQTTISPAVGNDELLRRAGNIRELFKTEFFQSVSGIQAGSRERTRQEIMEMKAESAAVLGAILGRIEHERIEPMVNMVLAIEAEAGRLPVPPKGLRKDSRLRMSLRGPLAQSQRKYLLIDGLTKGLAAAFELQGVATDIAMNFDLNGAARRLASANGFPADLLNDKKETETMQARAAAQRQALAAQQAQAEQIRSMGGSKRAEEGSAAAAAMGRE